MMPNPIEFSFKEKLDAIIGGDTHSYCFQCGACVSDCPAARYSAHFNPRLILLQAIHGRYQELIKENSVIWECTNCFNCYERCPQDVRPVEVIMALKNLAKQAHTSPPKVDQMVNAVLETGRTVVVTRTTQKIRAGLGLAPVKDAPVNELKQILS